MAPSIPRGIRVIDWKNADKSKSIRYRVRVERGSFVVDRSFAQLDHAKLFLEDAKSLEGQRQILLGQDRASLLLASLALSIANASSLPAPALPPRDDRRTLSEAVGLYIKAYVQPGLDSSVDKTRRSAKCAKARLLHCESVAIPVVVNGASAGAARRPSRKPIGEFFLDELNEQDTTGYIDARLKEGKAKSTVKREVYALQSVVNKLRYTDNKAWKALRGHNPFVEADKSKLRGGERRRRRVISKAEEDILLAELRRCRNPEMPLVFAVALATGMRRAEVLGLLWRQVDLDRGVIDLEADQTKAGEDRLVILLPEAVAALRAVPVVDERVFHYKIEGFKTNFRRVLERAGLQDIHMHDTRRSFISRVLKTITSSAVVVADMIGARSVSNLERRTIDRIRQNDMIEGGIRTEQELRWAVQHKDGQTTSRYTNMAPEKQ